MAENYQKLELQENQENHKGFNYPELPKDQNLEQQQQKIYSQQIQQQQSANLLVKPYQNQQYYCFRKPASQLQRIDLYQKLPISLVPINQQQFVPVQIPNLIIPNQPKTRFSEQLYCVNCRSIIPSRIDYKPGLGSMIVGGIIFCLGGWLGCCLIPCFVDDCQDVIHYCPKCSNEIGSKQFLIH